MQKLYTLIICTLLVPSMMLAQSSDDSKKGEKDNNSVDIIVIDENEEKAIVGFPKAKVEFDECNDTITKITLGHKRWEFIEEDDKTNVRMVHIPREKFKGHFSGVQLGFCNYMGPDHDGSLPAGADFLELNSGKSMAVSINLLQYNIGLQKRKKNVGLVTGLGWTVYNYRHDNQYGIQVNDQGTTFGNPIAEPVDKSKIVASYLNIPLLLEAQIPSAKDRCTAFVSAGVYGGFKLGSHTKIKYADGDKQKSRDDININPFQYGAMVQVGYKVLKLYATYNFSTLFEDGKGPEIYPYSVGLTLVNF
ncbi:outer membrane beta-barrel protein [Plebeiibacterium marinum]|uniref:PorT family protein n=1 Tax=Plebeiibacterium marinum TaxID=2992111 RepID=A0AAE3MG60_9BACT|nr:outer membrane beta-barrel protein [Plebeiobacterium marinum]MCW3807027.1 PorT family protein [Plebeiobacterium marinum]